jgi:uncharacterized SAM-dependent methyltransferase
MNTYKNSDVSKIFGVAPSTVTLWVKNAMEGKNNLVINFENRKPKILISTHNNNEIERLKNKGFKYRTGIAYSKLTPNPLIYKIFKPDQLIEFITKIEEEKTIPIKFSYLGEGANIWNDVFFKSSFDYIASEDALIEKSLPLIISKLEGFETVNLFDLSTGNGRSAISIIENLTKHGFKTNYTAISSSDEVIELTKSNLHNKFSDLPFSGANIDIEDSIFRQILFKKKQENTNSVNLILFLRDGIGEVRDRAKTLLNIKDSMSQNDYLIIQNGLRGQEEFVITSENFSTKEFNKLIYWLPGLLGFDSTQYKVVDTIDETTKERIVAIELLKDIDIEFKIDNKIKTIELYSGSVLNIWHYYSYTLHALENDLYKSNLLSTAIAIDKDFTCILAMCEANLNLFKLQSKN